MRKKNRIKRREFIFRGVGTISAFAVANASIYTIGSISKNLDGSLVAGAKSARWYVPSENKSKIASR